MTTKYYYLTILLSLLLLSSCMDNESIIVSSNDIFKFDNYEQYKNEVDHLRQLPEDEKQGYLESKGFQNSFGVNAMNIYLSLDIESVNSIDEIQDYVKKHSKYLTLQPDENSGEYVLETKLKNKPESYFINDDKVFQIGENYYKVFEDKTISTNKNNLAKLLKVTSSEEFNEINDSEIFISKISVPQSFDNGVIQGRDGTYNCGNGRLTDRAPNKNEKRDRTYIRIDLVAERPYQDVAWLIGSEWLIRPYKKTLGVWYYASRTITGSLKARVDYISDGDNFPFVPEGDWVREPLSDCNISPGNQYSYSNGKTIGYWLSPSNPYNAAPTFHFAGIDFWGDTPSVGENAEIKCNTGIVSCN